MAIAIDKLLGWLSTKKWIRNAKIGPKLTAGFGLLVGLTLLVMALSYFASIRAISKISHLSTHYVPLVLISSHAQVDIFRMLSESQNYLIVGDPQYLSRYRQAEEEFQTELTTLETFSSELDQEQIYRFKELEKDFENWKLLTNEFLMLPHAKPESGTAWARVKMDEQDWQRFNSKVVPLANQMGQLLVKIGENQEDLLGANLLEGRQFLDKVKIYIFWGGMVAIILGLIMVIIFQRNIVGPINRLAATAAKIARGDLDVKIPIESGDEIGELALTFDSMKKQFRDLIDHLENRVAERTNELEIAIKSLETTADISRQITSILELNELLQYVVTQIQTEFDFYHTHIYLVEKGTADLIMAEGSGEVGRQLKALGHRLPAGQGIVGTVASINEHFVSNNVSKFLNFIRNPLLPHTNSELAVPLRKGDHVLGVLDIQSEKINCFTPENISLMQSIADQVAIAIDNVILYERVHERTRALETTAEISRQITAILALNELLQFIVTRIQTEFKFYHTHIYLIEKESGDLIMAEGSGEVGRQLKAMKHRLPSGQGIVGTVAIMNEHFVSNNVSKFLNFVRNPLLPNTNSELAVPLHKGDQVLGVLDIQSEKLNRFAPEDVSLMQSIADQIAIAIDNATLYQSLEDALAYQVALTNGYSRFVPREILKFLGKKSIVEIQLGDQIQQEMTVLFSDIRAFTSLSEQMTPQENFNFINSYLSRVSPIIREQKGFIDKYIGDSIMALFPEPYNAVEAAIAIQHEVKSYNVSRGEQPINVVVGLHTGRVMLGTVGEAERMEGTVISDAVNLAARMEGLTKMYGASIAISEQTLSGLDQQSDKYNIRFLDRVLVKGRQDPVSVFEILDGQSTEIVALRLKTRPDFETALFHYQYEEFKEAKQYFENVLAIDPADEAAGLYLHRVNYFLEYGVQPDWQGVVTLTNK